LAKIYSKSSALFEEVTSITSPQDCYKLFEVEAGGYWTTHYNFDVSSKSQMKKLTRRFFDLLLINTLIPVRFAYAKYCANSGEEKLFEWAETIPAEKNRILDGFKSLEVPQINAIGCQSILHLYKSYCRQMRCLSCQVGFELMKTE